MNADRTPKAFAVRTKCAVVRSASRSPKCHTASGVMGIQTINAGMIAILAERTTLHVADTSLSDRRSGSKQVRKAGIDVSTAKVAPTHKWRMKRMKKRLL
mmetsp:Transcript_5937/g.17665  ORF Transcript_5937/g.17665 Transcript_5937/m.17665 type:complete len:100 (+) Transcript_5937:208-507(+)